MKAKTGQSTIFILLLMIIPLSIFYPLLNNGFTNWDDPHYIIDNPFIKSLSWENIRTIFTQPTVGLYSPLTVLCYAIEYKFYALNPSGYHATSLALHLFNILLTYFFINFLYQNRLVAFLTAAIFSFHPLNIEAIAWASSRKDLLFTFFYLLGLITYLKLPKKRVSYVITFTLFLLSCLAKPVAISFPIVLLLIDYYKNNKLAWKSITTKLHFIVVSVAFFIIGILLALKADPFNVRPFDYNLFDKITLAFYSLGYYIIHFFFPHNLSNFHAYPVKSNTLLPNEYLLAIVVVIVFFIPLINFKKRNPNTLFGSLFFLFTIGLTLRLLPSGFPIVSERYFYLPSIGLSFLSIHFLYSIAKNRPVLQYSSFIVCGFAILIYIKIDKIRISDWRSSLSLWEQTTKTNPDLYLAYKNYGDAYIEIGNTNLALRQYENALEIYDEEYEIINKVANIYMENGNDELALQLFNKVLVLKPDYDIGFYNRGNLHKRNNRLNEALEDYNKSLSLNLFLGSAYNNRGIIKILSKDTTGALNDFNKAVLLSPNEKQFKDNKERLTKILSDD